MRPRKTKIVSLDISSKIFASYNHAIKEANAIKQYLKRICQQHDYSACVIVGVSENSSQNGQLAKNRTGKRGRPAKVFILDKDKSKVNPHIHIIIYANPADTVCDIIRNYINKKYNGNYVWKSYCGKYIVNKIKYVLCQSTTIRTLKINPEHTLNLPWFQMLLDKSCKGLDCDRIIFTNQTYTKCYLNACPYKDISYKKLLKILVCNRPIQLSNTNRPIQLSNTTIFSINRYLSIPSKKCLKIAA